MLTMQTKPCSMIRWTACNEAHKVHCAAAIVIRCACDRSHRRGDARDDPPAGDELHARQGSAVGAPHGQDAPILHVRVAHVRHAQRSQVSILSQPDPSTVKCSANPARLANTNNRHSQHARRGTARRGTARHGTARHGTARHGTARQRCGGRADAGRVCRRGTGGGAAVLQLVLRHGPKCDAPVGRDRKELQVLRQILLLP